MQNTLLSLMADMGDRSCRAIHQFRATICETLLVGFLQEFKAEAEEYLTQVNEKFILALKFIS